MLRVVSRRLVFLVFVVLGVSVVTFVISHILPGDPVRMLAGPRASPELLARIRSDLGLDRPILTQYVVYLQHVAVLNFGTSIVSGRPIAGELFSRVPATLELMGTALVLSVALGITLGVLAAVNKDGWIDQLVRGSAVVGISMPSFWLGLLLILFFYGRLGMLPGSGRISGSPPSTITGFYVLDAVLTANGGALLDAVAHLALPALTLCIIEVGGIARLVRSSMLDVLKEDYVLTGRASGLRERVVIWQIALRNALIPYIALFGLSLASLLYGSVVVETVFSWPGTGKYVVDSIFNLDFPVIMAFTLLVSIAYVVANLLVDLAYLALDPQIRDVG